MSKDLQLGPFDGNESSVTENDTMVECESLEIFELLTSPKTIFKLITAIVIIFANTVLISIILRSTKFRRQRFHKFIVSLAFADLLIGVTIPFMTLTAKEHTWHLGPSLCQVRTIAQLLEGCKSINQTFLHASGVHKSAEGEPGGVHLPLPWSFFGQILCHQDADGLQAKSTTQLEPMFSSLITLQSFKSWGFSWNNQVHLVFRYSMLSFYDISVAQHLCCFAKIDFPIDLSQRTSTKEQDHPPPSGCVLAAGVDRGDPHVARSGQPLSRRGGSEQVHLQISLSICKLSILKN